MSRFLLWVVRLCVRNVLVGCGFRRPSFNYGKQKRICIRKYCFIITAERVTILRRKAMGKKKAIHSNIQRSVHVAGLWHWFYVYSLFPMLFAARCRLLDVVFGRAKFSRAKDSKFYLVSKCNWILFRLSLLVFFCVSINAKQFFVYSSLKECSVQLHRFENSICESVATGGLCAMHRTISFVCQLWLTEIIWVKIFEIL